MPEFNFKSPVVTRKVRETEIILEEVIPKKLVLCLMLMVELFLINL